MKEAKLVNLLRTKCCYCHLLFRFSKSNTYKWLESPHPHADTKISFFQIVASAVVRVLTYTEETMCRTKMTKYLETTLWRKKWDTNHTKNIQTLSFSFLSNLLQWQKYSLIVFFIWNTNYREIVMNCPTEFSNYWSKQLCASELNLLAQNSCSSAVHNNVNFE